MFIRRPGAGLPISLLERRANKKTREKGRNLKPRNARVHAFRGNFHLVIHAIRVVIWSLEIPAFRGNFSSGYPRDKGLCLT